MKRESAAVANHSTFKDSNSFELLGIEPTFEVDMVALDEAYFARQALAHPDRFVYHSEPERQAAAAQAASLNHAYNVLKSPVSRAKALLTLRGIDTQGEEKAVQAPDILGDMMDLRETLEQAVSPSDLERLGNQVHDRLQAVMVSFGSALRQENSQELPDLFLRLTYLSKLRGDIRVRQQQSSVKVL